MRKKVSTKWLEEGLRRSTVSSCQGDVEQWRCASRQAAHLTHQALNRIRREQSPGSWLLAPYRQWQTVWERQTWRWKVCRCSFPRPTGGRSWWPGGFLFHLHSRLLQKFLLWNSTEIQSVWFDSTNSIRTIVETQLNFGSNMKDPSSLIEDEIWYFMTVHLISSIARQVVKETKYVCRISTFN